MRRMTITVEGTKKQLKEFEKDVQERLNDASLSDDVEVSNLAEAPPSLTDQRPLGAEPVMVFVISVAGGLVANAAYDLVKSCIKKYRLRSSESSNDDDSDE